jgi:hypothetical protein
MQAAKKIDDYMAQIEGLKSELSLVLENQSLSDFTLPQIDYDRIETELYQLLEELNNESEELKSQVDPFLKELRLTVEEGHEVILKHINLTNNELDLAIKNKRAIHAYTRINPPKPTA